MSQIIKIIWDWLKYQTLSIIKWILLFVWGREISCNCYLRGILLKRLNWEIVRKSLFILKEIENNNLEQRKIWYPSTANSYKSCKTLIKFTLTKKTL